jgi:cytidylate kinase
VTTRILAIAGQPGSGKTTLVDFLEREHGYNPVRPSKIIRTWAESRGSALGVDRRLWAEARQRIGEERGQDWLTQTIFDTPAQRIVLDGLRTMGDFGRLRHRDQAGLARVALIGLICPPEIRFNHIVSGKAFDKDKPSSFEDFLAQEAPEYYSYQEYGIATQAILDLVPDELKVEYTTESREQVQEIVAARLVGSGFWEG